MLRELVVHDPAGRLLPGEEVSAEAARELRGRHGASVPFEKEPLEGSALDYHVRYFGRGVELPGVPQKLAGLVLRVQPGVSVVHWRARVVPDMPKVSCTCGSTPETHPHKTDCPASDPGLYQCEWRVRLVGDGTQPHVMLSGFASVEDKNSASSDRCAPCPDGGWVVGGDVPINQACSGLLGLMMYGGGLHARLAWAAASVTLGR